MGCHCVLDAGCNIHPYARRLVALLRVVMYGDGFIGLTEEERQEAHDLVDRSAAS